MPRHPADEILQQYVNEDEEEGIEQARVDLRRRIDSHPPPSALTASRERLIERVGTNTGSYDLHTLEREVRSLVERSAAEKINEEVERRKRAEERLDDQRKFWSGIVASVIAGCAIGVIVWVTVTLMHVSH